MTKYSYILFIIFCLTLGESYSQCLLFNETKSASTQSNYYKALEYNNNYYIVGGGVSDTEENQQVYNDNYHALIVKTDICGKTLWKKFIGNPSINNIILDIKIDKGYIYIQGGTEENSRQGTNFLAKLDEDGNVIWYKVYRTNDNDLTCSNFLINNNQLIMYGYHEIYQNTPFTYNMYLLQLDTSGRIVKEYEFYKNNGENTFQKIFKTVNGWIAFASAGAGFKYGKNNELFQGGTLICTFDNSFSLIKIDTIKRNYPTNGNLIDYNPLLKKYIMHISHWISNDSTHRQIAFLDSTGKLEKIIEDPFNQNYTPQNLIAFQNGWLANLYGLIIKYDSNYVRQKILQLTRDGAGWYNINNTAAVNNGNSILVSGNCKGCNPYDDNTNSKYERPTAVMIDSNFKDFGKAQPPYVPYAAINLFPNPSRDNITLQITEREGVYSIYNSYGKFISSGTMLSNADIGIGNLAQGMYIIHIKTPQGGNVGSVKFVKKD